MSLVMWAAFAQNASRFANCIRRGIANSGTLHEFSNVVPGRHFRAIKISFSVQPTWRQLTNAQALRTNPMSIDLKDHIRDIPDFPKPGIVFKDITPLLSNAAALGASIDQFAERYKDQKIDAILAAESRGFLFGAPLAIKLGASLIPVRKPGKLPADVYSHSYDLEYGSDTLEIHKDALKDGQRVLIIDDLLATGGTILACLELLKNFDVEVVELAFCINLSFLNGAAKLAPHPVFSLLEY